MPLFPFYQQREAMDCGPTCLYMIGKHYGRSFNINQLRKLSEIGKEGVSLLGISDAAEKIGFRTQGVRLDLQQLKSAKLPAILHWSQYHFVVLYNIKRPWRLSRIFRFRFPSPFGEGVQRTDEARGGGEAFYIADPAAGLFTLNQKQFEQRWLSATASPNPSEGGALARENNESHERLHGFQNPPLEGREAFRESVGIALLLEPTPAFYENEYDDGFTEQKGKGFGSVVKYLYPYKKLVLQLILGLLLGSLLQLVLPFLTQSVVDTGINTSNLGFVQLVLAAQLALLAGRLFTDFIRGWILYHISSRINISILTDFLIKLMKLPISYFDSKRTGDIMQRMNDHSRIQNFLTGTSLTTLFSLFNLLVFSAVLANYNLSIFGVFALASVLYVLWIVLFLKRRKQLDYKQFDVASAEQGKMIQLVQGMTEIKLQGCEKTKRWEWERLQAKTFRLGMRGLALNQWEQTGAFFINEGKNIFITFLAAAAVIKGVLTLGEMLAIQYIIGQLNGPIEQMVGFVQSWQLAKISLDRLNEIHGLADEETASLPSKGGVQKATSASKGGALAPNNLEPKRNMHGFQNPPLEGREAFPLEGREASIQLQNVSFTYQGAGNEPVLRDINLTIPTGKTTAIVGTSGSGKTTLLKLLLKFYPPQKGVIKVGGNDLENINHRAWRQGIGVVMQESFIFSESIAANIAVDGERMDMQHLKEATKTANVLDFIESLPLGFNTNIGAEGNGISMGQRQRILIARAVYKKPDYLFFDEATNSLDANNETAIMKNLSAFTKGRTVIVVAHRLSTVKNADQIVVLNKGMITEKGTHTELTALKGEYYTLVKNQLELGD